MELRTDNRGVSPVIGVVLMVGITVILAAVVGVAVLDIGSDLSQKQASASVSVDGSTVNLISLGDDTDGIKCVPSGNMTSTVGSQLDCSGDSSVVAYSNSTDVRNVTVRTI